MGAKGRSPRRDRARYAMGAKPPSPNTRVRNQGRLAAGGWVAARAGIPRPRPKRWGNHPAHREAWLPRAGQPTLPPTHTYTPCAISCMNSRFVSALFIRLMRNSMASEGGMSPRKFRSR